MTFTEIFLHRSAAPQPDRGGQSTPQRSQTGRSQTSLSRNWESDGWQRALALGKRILHLNRRAPRRLRLCESLPLGERRFVAVVEFEGSRFLLGGTASSLVLLARLPEPGEEEGKEHSAKLGAENHGVAEPVIAFESGIGFSRQGVASEGLS
ncbi:MAG TPA: flagellar biosynthetic protein FliO [Terriglobales bacterium]|nr:flagellar biosynthetic protein FliO [Terriglobales bacterium]